MRSLHIPADEFTPLVEYNAESNSLHLSGMSVPEDTKGFYLPVLEWIDEFFKTPPSQVFVFEVKLVYFNTSSSKMIYDLLAKINKNQHKLNGLRVIWFYNDEDDYMFEAGNNFSELVDLPFEFKPFE